MVMVVVVPLSKQLSQDGKFRPITIFLYLNELPADAEGVSFAASVSSACQRKWPGGHALPTPRLQLRAPQRWFLEPHHFQVREGPCLRLPGCAVMWPNAQADGAEAAQLHGEILPLCSFRALQNRGQPHGPCRAATKHWCEARCSAHVEAPLHVTTYDLTTRYGVNCFFNLATKRLVRSSTTGTRKAGSGIPVCREVRPGDLNMSSEASSPAWLRCLFGQI